MYNGRITIRANVVLTICHPINSVITLVEQTATLVVWLVVSSLQVTTQIWTFQENLFLLSTMGEIAISKSCEL